MSISPPPQPYMHAAFVIPSSSAQVKAALVCAESAQLPFVVRGGGHSYTAASLISDGVVVDLRNMVGKGVRGCGTLSVERIGADLWLQKCGIYVAPVLIDLQMGIVIDAKARTAVIGAGQRLGPIYLALAASGFYIPAGTCIGVGISGLTLGGGAGGRREPLGRAQPTAAIKQVI